MNEDSRWLTPSPTLPRKREREGTAFAARMSLQIQVWRTAYRPAA